MKKNSGQKLAPRWMWSRREIIKTLAASLQATCAKFSNAAEKMNADGGKVSSLKPTDYAALHLPTFQDSSARAGQKICDDFDIASMSWRKP